ncbi:MAG: 2'-5' RNA ligase [Candidatus Magasanikbacteria bacterium RIFCSPHIGHO2_01_FULL_50_8]|uniref:RNA 2',3'-cyclic phosphodiesterase n=2 Tax=Candidatus Magasanikiibacteriota TaxID=1752731 RepID=A0A1F6LRA2_9BACT|nr:MAG: 2'-5' RNA ligase [Candidatus Magasanikbacteria bacterium RIFCSPHIGHO2_01_FULL_50_8]OGH67693.1 MAG: 2'-5' RNA ligase [Candidatus Magasanikbacteria bacterium RIFCSPHIGHO2_02_FULL_50_9b]
MQRIFVGIKIPKEIQQPIAIWRAGFAHMPVRWIRDHDLHITIIPPWNEINIHGVLVRMRQALAGRRPFSIDLHKITLAPDPRKPRLIWAEGHPSEKLQAIKMALHRCLNHADERPLRPHVTISRFSRLLFRTLGIKKLCVPVKWHFPVTSVILYESPQIPGKGYRIIEEFNLDDRYEFLSHSRHSELFRNTRERAAS